MEDHHGHNMNMENKTKTEPMMTMTMTMQMHGGFQELIVFDTWLTKDLGAFIGSCVGLMIIAALYEGIKSLREWLMKLELSQYYENQSIYAIFRWKHLLQTLLHMIQVTISYFLMLVIMTYNSYIFGSIILGAGLGYFLFAFKRTTIIDVNEHCH